MSLSYWVFLDNNATNTTDTYCFTTQRNESEMYYFAIIAEALPKATKSTRSKIGAKLLVDASPLALKELQNQELDFATHFFTLLNKAWKAKVLLHAIQNPFPDSDLLSIEKLTKNNTLSEEVVKNYDASIGIVYLEGNQLIHLQCGDTQLAILNKRNNCEIKEADQQSLSSLLNTVPTPYQRIDIKKYQLEMMALLPHKYTTPKTGARLKSNILKIYRSFESSDLQIESTDNNQLIILKKDQKKITKPITTKKISYSATSKKERPKKSMNAYTLSIFLLVSGITASYFLWQVQAKEGASTSLPSDSFVTTQRVLNKTPEAIPPKEIIVKVTDEQLEVKEQIDKLKLLQQKKAEQVEIERAEKKARIEKENARQLQKEEQTAIAEALKIKAVETEKVRKEKERFEAEAKEMELQLEQEIKLQQQAEEQKKRDHQAKVKRTEALIKQRRREFENKKNKQMQSAPPAKANTPKSREELHRQNQVYIKQKEVEKKRIVTEELQKQQARKVKAKETREKIIQKTITHQLMNYSKIFHRHVVQLKQKNQAIKLLEQRKISSNDANIIRNQEMLQSKKNDIKQHIDRLAILYVGKLKRLCANKVIYPVIKPAKSTKVERIALSVISQQLRNCSQSQTLSSKNISRTLVNRYLK